jgi:hypothetical protein
MQQHSSKKMAAEAANESLLKAEVYAQVLFLVP